MKTSVLPMKPPPQLGELRDEVFRLCKSAVNTETTHKAVSAMAKLAIFGNDYPSFMKEVNFLRRMLANHYLDAIPDCVPEVDFPD